MIIEERMAELNVSRFVIWGIKAPFHSHHFIHLGFFKTLKSLGIPVIWLEDSTSNQSYLKANDLVISVDVGMRHLKKIPKVYYCIHNPLPNFLSDLQEPLELILQVLTFDVYERNINSSSSYLDGVAFFNHHENTLYQSWGTPLLSKDFLSPIVPRFKGIEFFVGSIWDNDLSQGNLRVIQSYKKSLDSYKIRFCHAKGIPERLNSVFVRNAALAISVVGEWQETHGYSPCRMFKAISYGRVGAINSIKSQKQYPWIMANSNIGELVSSVIDMKDKQIIEFVRFQQKFLALETYESKLKNILQCFIEKNQSK